MLNYLHILYQKTTIQGDRVFIQLHFLFFSKTLWIVMYFKKFISIFFILAVISQAQGIPGCGGSIKASPAMMK